MSNNKNKEGMMKYLIIQVVASTVLILAAVSLKIRGFTVILFNILFILALVMKLGGFPLHY